MKNLKKLGELKLMPEKMLNQDELVNFRGGSGGIPFSDVCPTQECANCMGICLGDAAVDCEDQPPSCEDDAYTWCGGYCGSGV